jgi:hypothetical protein
MAMATPLSGALEYSTDVDWFSFQGTARHAYRVTFTAAGAVTADLWDAAGAASLTSPLAGGYSYSSGTSTLGCEAAVTGTYYLRLRRASPSTPASYTVQVEDLGLDDYGDVYSQASAVSVGGTTGGSLEFGGDADWFRFTGIPEHIYQVKAAASGPIRLGLYSKPASNVADETSYATTPAVTAKVTSTSSYYVRIQPDTSVGLPITYTLEVIDLGLDDFGDTANEASTLTLGVAKSGNIQYRTDYDWFSLVTVPGPIYRVDLAATSARMKLYGPDGKTELQTAYANQGVVFGGTEGPYYLAVYGTEAAQPYTLTATEVGIDDHGNSAANATVLGVGTAQGGVIQYCGDQDTFSVALLAQHIYQFEVVPELFSVRLELSQDGSLIQGNSVFPFRRRMATSATYHLSVKSQANCGTGTYSLQVVDLGMDDHGDSVAEATPLTIGTTTEGEIQFLGDVDWLELSMVAGWIYRLTVTPLGFSVRASLMFDGQSGSGSQSSYAPMVFDFKAPGAQSYYLKVESQFSSGMGRYSVLTEDLGPDDAGSSIADPSPIAVGAGPIAGAIQYGSDRDVYSFQVEAGALTLQLSVQGPLATNWRVFSFGGSVLASGTGPGTSPLVFPSAGKWYLDILAEPRARRASTRSNSRREARACLRDPQVGSGEDETWQVRAVDCSPREARSILLLAHEQAESRSSEEEGRALAPGWTLQRTIRCRDHSAGGRCVSGDRQGRGGALPHLRGRPVARRVRSPDIRDTTGWRVGGNHPKVQRRDRGAEFQNLLRESAPSAS